MGLNKLYEDGYAFACFGTKTICIKFPSSVWTDFWWSQVILCRDLLLQMKHGFIIIHQTWKNNSNNGSTDSPVFWDIKGVSRLSSKGQVYNWEYYANTYWTN